MTSTTKARPRLDAAGRTRLREDAVRAGAEREWVTAEGYTRLPPQMVDELVGPKGAAIWQALAELGAELRMASVERRRAYRPPRTASEQKWVSQNYTGCRVPASGDGRRRRRQWLERDTAYWLRRWLLW